MHIYILSIGLSTNKRKRTIIMPTLLTSFVQDFIYTGSIPNPYAYTHGLNISATKLPILVRVFRKA